MVGAETGKNFQNKINRRKFLSFSYKLALIAAGASLKESGLSLSKERPPNQEGLRKSRVFISVYPQDTLEEISQRWSILGATTASIKKMNGLRGNSLNKVSRLVIPLILPKEKDLSESPKLYQSQAGNLGLDFLKLFKKTPQISLPIEPPEIIPQPISFSSSENDHRVDWRTLSAEALKIKYDTEAIVPPQENSQYHQELAFGAQRLSEYHRLRFGALVGQGGRAQETLSSLKINDVYFSLGIILSQLKNWGLYREECGQDPIFAI
ncbi:MAG: hypothetical protein ACOYJ8_01425 [Patescibacteria group bacterium]|jgi:hypothetical protein